MAVNQLGNNGWEADFQSAGLSLPMVQDNDSDLIWNNWGGGWRDVMILDPNNELVGQFNLTDFSLADPTNYETLKNMLIEAHP